MTKKDRIKSLENLYESEPDMQINAILDILIDMNKPSKSKFVPPTPLNVDYYCATSKNPPVGQEFCDFYESKGWMVGKNKMKSWQAAVRNWCKGRKKVESTTESLEDQLERVQAFI